MAQPLMALAVKNPEIDAVTPFQKGAATQMQFNAEDMRQGKQRMADMSAMALGVMGGDLNGQPDPARWQQAIDYYSAQTGQDLSKYRERPGLAPIIARAGMDTMQQLQVAKDERSYQLALRKFNHSIASQAAKQAAAQGQMDVALEYLNSVSPDLAAQARAGRPLGEVWDALDALGETPDPKSPLGKITADYESGFIDESTRDAAISKATQQSGGITIGPDGTVQIGGMPKLTEGQSKDVVYTTRATGSLPVIDEFGDELTNPLSRAVEGDPTGLVRGSVQSDEYQKAQQAGSEFLTAILRKDTGAAIHQHEMQTYGRTYLPFPGDSGEVLEQKKGARRRALKALKLGLPAEAILQMEKSGVDVSGAISGDEAGSVVDYTDYFKD